MFEHKNMIKKDGYFYLEPHVTARVAAVIDKPILRELWNGFCFSLSDIDFTVSDKTEIVIGKAKCPELLGNDYAINVEKEGVAIAASNEKNLIYGYLTLLDCIVCEEEGQAKLPCCEFAETPEIENRFIHYCVFPDTPFWEFSRFVRLCGALKYTHIVIEFWGMIKYDCLGELSWKHAFTKDEVSKIAKEARDLGISIIPMINHWGHATQSRVMHGKHVVLSQNPSLQYLFSDDGWCWSIKNKKTRELLRTIRNELIDLFGNVEYFHIGCDEAYGFGYSREEMDEISTFINETAEELEERNIKTIMWADMLLYSENKTIYAAAPDREHSEYMMSRISKKVIMADWQYGAVDVPVESSVCLKNAGFKVLLCPWDRGYQTSAVSAQTVKSEELFGIMHTTWHTLSSGMRYVGKIAKLCWENESSNKMCINERNTAAVLRKVYPTYDSYEKSGWASYEIGVNT